MEYFGSSNKSIIKLLKENKFCVIIEGLQRDILYTIWMNYSTTVSRLRIILKSHSPWVLDFSSWQNISPAETRMSFLEKNAEIYKEVP